MSLDLPSEKEDRKTFERAFEKTYAEREVKRHCPMCSEKPELKNPGAKKGPDVDWTSKSHFAGLPAGSFVIMQLKRFLQDDYGRRSKNQVQIENVPFKLQISFDLGQTLNTMALRSFVVHNGDLDHSGRSSGHYLAYVRIGDTDEWKFFNDLSQSYEKPPTITHDAVRNALKDAYTM